MENLDLAKNQSDCRICYRTLLEQNISSVFSKSCLFCSPEIFFCLFVFLAINKSFGQFLLQDILQEKIEKVAMQHEEACKIKEVNDKRGEVVSKILENCLEEEDYADFKYYIDMKTQLALMHAEIRDKVKMGEEKLNTLHSTKIDWSILSLA